MRITRTATLPAGVEDVFSLISSQEYQAAKVAAQAERSSASVTEQAGGAVGVHTERELPTNDIPAVLASMVGDTVTVTEQQNWSQPQPDGSRTADLEIRVAGIPLQLVGRLTLAPDGDASSLDVAADLDCSVPFVGSRIESAARPTIEDSIDHEVRLLGERLS